MDIRVVTASENVGFMSLISSGQYFVTVHDMGDGFGSFVSCREYKSRRSDENATPKGWIRESTKIGPVLEVQVTYHMYQYGI